MRDRPKVFLDTSVLIALALSTRERPPGRYFFELAIHGLIDIVVSRDIIRELEAVLRLRVLERAAALTSLIVENLELARTTFAGEPADDTVRDCLGLVGYRPDARILAAAVETACEALITADSEHLLGNPQIGPPAVRLIAMSVGEGLQWCRDQISIRSRW